MKLGRREGNPDSLFSKCSLKLDLTRKIFWEILLMEKILPRLGCPKRIFNSSIKTLSGIASGVGFFPSTVSYEKTGCALNVI